jgi:hypothetical protein
MYSALKEGEVTWAEIMDGREGKKPEGESKKESITDRIRQKSVKAEPMSPELTKVNEAFKALSVPPLEQAQLLKDYEGKLPDLLAHLSKMADEGAAR